jgi:hypothetical protein
VRVKDRPQGDVDKAAVAEIRAIQDGFAAIRDCGGWDSEYPQTAFSRVLGVMVREVRLPT